MSKPSGTNYLKTFRKFLLYVLSDSQNHYFWWLWSECSPLPIPNREVKPHIADDTALVCGKVGRRQFFIRESQSRFPFLFVLPAAYRLPQDSPCHGLQPCLTIPSVPCENKPFRLSFFFSAIFLFFFGYLFFLFGYLDSLFFSSGDYQSPPNPPNICILHFTFHILFRPYGWHGFLCRD